MTLALLCSGQGTQHRDMFTLTAPEDAAAGIFAAGRSALDGDDPRDLVRHAPETVLHGNTVAQVLCCTQALAAYACLAPHLPARIVLAGYSVGEWAAWGCAGLLQAEDVPGLVRLRARLMDAASGPDGALAAVSGLARAHLDALCDRHAVDIAILNPADRYVVGGRQADLEALCTEALAAGARQAKVLPVSTPSHTQHLAAAVAPLRTALDHALLHRRLPPGLRLVSGRDGSLVRGTEGDAQGLANQVAVGLDWAAALRSCAELGVGTVLELGPGHALADMARDVLPAARARSLEDFTTFDSLRRWLAASPS